MNNDRYSIIKKSLPSSILMAMEHIRRFLDDGKASVMVGAGFSKNAIKPDFVEMKDWNALGNVFYKLLYSHIRNRAILNLKLRYVLHLRLRRLLDEMSLISLLLNLCQMMLFRQVNCM